MKTGFVGLLGLPNAGKSTLVNALIGEKVGIVTNKPQTTRRRILGIYNDPESQIIFVDSPGKVQNTKALNQYLKEELNAIIADSDLLLVTLNLDAKDPEHLKALLEQARDSGKPWLAVITKDDLPFPQRNPMIRDLVSQAGGEVIAVSALKKVEALRELLIPKVKERLPVTGSPLYPQDIFTTETERGLVEEVVREKCFQVLHEEVPFGLATKCLSFKEDRGRPECQVEIIVSKKNHIPMVVGRGGQNIKRIGTESRLECENRLGKKLILKTHVKCVEDWHKKNNMMRELGYAQHS